MTQSATPRAPHGYEFSAGEQDLFSQLLRSLAMGNTAMVRCIDARTGAAVALICSTHEKDDGSGFELVPIARLIDGDAYAQFLPPGDVPGTFMPLPADRVAGKA